MQAKDVLRVSRAYAGFTQQEAAGMYGVTEKTYRSWEKGGTAAPFDAVCSIVNDVFKLSLTKVLELKDVESKEPAQRA